MNVDIGISINCVLDCNIPDCMCTDMYFLCEGGGCVPLSKLCNGNLDCSDGTDEYMPCRQEIISTGYVINNRNTLSDKFKLITKFLCTKLYNSEYFLPSDICIYDPLQHVGCAGGQHLLKCEIFECSRMFKCPGSYCIPVRYICDNKWDCFDGSDENHCSDLHICLYLFHCEGEISCLHLSEVCDGRVHCRLSHDDEEICVRLACPEICTCRGNALMCQNTNMTTVPFVSIQTKAIVFSGNMIHVWTGGLHMYNTLVCLVVPKNNIKILLRNSLENYKQVVEINLGFNSISYIYANTFRSLTELRKLNIEDNPLQITHECVFYGMSNALQIVMKKGDIEHIHKYTFISLTNLEHLDISANNINDLDMHIFIAQKMLKLLNISSNHILKLRPILFTYSLSLENLYTDDFRICCIFIDMKNCCPKPTSHFSCERILLKMSHSVCVFLLCILCVCFSLASLVQALYCNTSATKAVVIIFECIDGFLLAFYLVIIMIADKEFNIDYIAFDEAWRTGYVCAISKMLVFFSHSGFLLFHLIAEVDIYIRIVLVFIIKPLTARKMTIILLNINLVLFVSSMVFARYTYLDHEQGLSELETPPVCLPLIFYSKVHTWRQLRFAYTTLVCAVFIIICICNFSIIFVVHTSRHKTGQQRNNILFIVNKTVILIPSFMLMFLFVIMVVFVESFHLQNRILGLVFIFVLALTALFCVGFPLATLHKCTILMKRCIKVL